MRILLATMLCNVMLLNTMPCDTSVRFNTAFEYYKYAEQYFSAHDYVTTITGYTVPSVGKPQVMYGQRQSWGEEHYFQNVVLGASTLGKNPSGVIQRFRDDTNMVSYKSFKLNAPKHRGDVVQVDFGKSNWTICTPEAYRAMWKTSPERLLPFNISADTPSKIFREKNGDVVGTFYISFPEAADYVGNIKASSNIGVKSGNFTVTIVFDKDARATKIIENSTYKMSILTSPSVTAAITETIEYKSLPLSRNNASSFVYKW